MRTRAEHPRYLTRVTRMDRKEKKRHESCELADMNRYPGHREVIPVNVTHLPV